MLKKQNYVAPAAEVLHMKFDRNFMETDTGESYKPIDSNDGNGGNGGFVIEP